MDFLVNAYQSGSYGNLNIRFCSIYDKTPIELHGEATASILNSIIWWGDQQFRIWLFGNSSLDIAYSCIKGGSSGVYKEPGSGSTLVWGLGNLDLNPVFADTTVGDLHLKSQAGRWNGTGWVMDDVTSACIDTGCPGTPLGDEPADANNVRVNMGVYGGTAEASKSPAGWGCLTDSDNSGITNDADLLLLRSSWLNSGEDLPCDYNHDGNINSVDLLTLRNGWLCSAHWFVP